MVEGERPVWAHREAQRLVGSHARQDDGELREPVVARDGRSHPTHASSLEVRRGYDAAVPHAVLIALILFGLAVGAGLAAATVSGLRAWRDFRAFRRTVLGRLGRLGDDLAALERRSATAGDTAQRLDLARRRLQRTLELAAVVTGATLESWSLVRRVRGAVPHK